MQAYNSVLDAKVNMLVGLGFSPKPAREALDASKGNVDDAIEFLLAAKGWQSKEKKEGVSSHGKKTEGQFDRQGQANSILNLTHTSFVAQQETVALAQS